MIEKELKALEQNLIKREEFLGDLQKVYNKQSDLLESGDMDLEKFDISMEEQDQLLQKLVALNEEADELYESLRTEESLAFGSYAEQVGCLKELISTVQNKTDSLQKQEKVNKEKLEFYFENERKGFGAGRRSSKAALDYYKSMSRSNVVPPQFMDHKK